MENPRSFPDNRNYEYAYNQSYKIAVEQLAGISDYEALCRNSDIRYLATPSQKLIEVEYLNRKYYIDVEAIAESPLNIITTDEKDAYIPLKEQILILHYILNARGTPLSGQMITFKELPEGMVYFRTFNTRTIKHLVNNFSENPQSLLEVAKPLGGVPAGYGDAAVTIKAFPHIPITFVIWKGDAEFPAEGNVLYDSTVTDYLPTEDIIVLSETVVWKMVKGK